MNIFTKLFSKTIQKAIQDGISSHILSGTTFGKWFAKYGNASGNLDIMAEAYKEELYIYGCVQLISNTIASLPLKIYRDIKKNNKVIKEEILTHPGYKLFAKPNFKDSFYDIKESISANLEITGNAFMLVEGENPTAIYSLISNKVKIIPKEIDRIFSLADMIKGYEYLTRKGDKAYSINEIIHEKKFNIDNEYYGMSPIQAAALTIDTTIEAKRQNYNIFKQGMNTDGAFESDLPFNDNAHKRLTEDIKNKYAGTDNAHKDLILWNGLKYKQMGIAQKDLQYVEGLKLNREELCGFLYQVPLMLLGVLENSSYNNIKEAEKIFYHICITPRLAKNEELYQKLIDKFNIEGAYCEFDLSGVEALKEDLGQKIDRANKLWMMGVPYNEIAEAIDLPVKNIEGGDVGYLPFSVSPIGSGKKPPAPGGELIQTESIKIKELNKIVWTEEKKVAKWKAFDNRLDKIETKYKSALNNFFNEQEKEVIINLDKVKSLSYEKIADNTFVIYSEIDGHKKAINIESVLFDFDDNIKKLKKTNIKYHTEAVKETGQAEIDLLGIEAIFNVNDPRIIKWLDKNALLKAKEVLETDREALKEILITAVNEGQSIQDIIKNVQEYYEEYEIDAYNIERIARTEILGASNEGALESYRQVGVEKKGWLATRDDRTRDSHLMMEEKYTDGIPINDDFVNDATGGKGQCPGQMGLAEDDINCRCTLLGLIDKEQ